MRPNRTVRPNRRQALMLAAGFALPLAACSAPAPAPTTAPATAASPAPSKPAADSKAAPAQTTGEAIKIAIPVNVTGFLAAVGQPVRDGALLAIEDLNAKGGVGGRKLEGLVEDTANTNDTGSNAVRKLLSEKPLAIVGLPFSNQAVAATAAIKEAQVTAIVLGTNPSIGPNGKPWIWQIETNNEIAVSAGTDFLLKNLGKKQLAVLTSNDENGKSAAAAAIKTLERAGLKPVTQEEYAVGDKDTSGQLLKIRSTNADGIMHWGDQAGMAIVIRQAKQLGVTLPMVSATLTADTLKVLTDDELDGQYLAYRSLTWISTDPQTKAFQDAYKKKYNKDSDEYAGNGYDAVMLIAQAVEKGAKTSEDIHKYLATVKDYKGVTETHFADANNQLSHSMEIARFKGRTPEVAARVTVQA